MNLIDLPYQHDGARWLASQRRAGLADEQGLGKTVQAIMAADKVEAQRLVVVCPAKLASTWRAELAEKSQVTRKTRVLSYEAAAHIFSTARVDQMRDIDVVIDEAQYLKNWQSQRTQAIYPKAHYARHLWSLSGTPMPNDPSELWTHFYYMRPELIARDGMPMTPGQWLEEHCHLGRAYGGRQKVLGAKQPEALRALNRELWKRRRLSEVMPQLPPMREGEIIIDVDDATANDIHDQVTALGPEYRRRLLIDPDTLPFGDEHLSTLRKLLAAAKAPVLAEFVEEELTNNPGEKLVIFAWHTEAIDILAERLRGFGSVVVDGRTNPNKVHDIVQRFQTQDDCRVFVGQMRAAGTGLTLTAASNVIFLELSWTPTDNEQAQRRILRIGQRADSVLCRYVVLSGSVDEVVTRVLRRKTGMIKSIIH